MLDTPKNLQQDLNHDVHRFQREWIEHIILGTWCPIDKIEAPESVKKYYEFEDMQAMVKFIENSMFGTVYDKVNRDGDAIDDNLLGIIDFNYARLLLKAVTTHHVYFAWSHRKGKQYYYCLPGALVGRIG